MKMDISFRNNGFYKKGFCKKLVAGFGSVLLAVSCFGAWAQDKAAGAAEDPVLVKNEWVEVRKSDFDTFVLRLPGNTGGMVANDQRAIISILQRILRDKTMAARARAGNLYQDPRVKAFLMWEIERFYAKLSMDKLEREAGEAFAKQEAVYAARAPEIYQTNKEKSRRPAQVNAAHILIQSEQRSPEEALKLAQEVRAKIVAGEDFAKVAQEYSADKASLVNHGDLGWFASEEMVPEFSKAAFALKEGEVSEPVQTQFGWHVILLKGKREASVLPFEEVKDAIMAEQKQQFVAEYVKKELANIDDHSSTVLNEPAIDALYIAPPSQEEINEIVRQAQEKAAAQSAEGEGGEAKAEEKKPEEKKPEAKKSSGKKPTGKAVKK